MVGGLEWRNISIHAPTRGATGHESRLNRDMTFQSTPPHGERPGLPHHHLRHKKFQSTPPHGERQYKGDVLYELKRFQSTPPHGERRLSVCSCFPNGRFQSTPPHGERQQKRHIYSAIFYILLGNFNKNNMSL